MPAGTNRNREDLALLWCLEKLLSSTKVKSDPLMTFMANLSWNSLLSGHCPYSFKCRIFLHRLKWQDSLTMETVESLETLASLVRSWSRDNSDTTAQSDIAHLIPDPQLIIDAKTAMVVQHWIDNPNASLAENRKRVLDVFGVSVPSVERGRYEECMRATKDSGRREMLTRQIDSQSILHATRAFADSCLDVLGMPVIDAVLEDASSGRYTIQTSSFPGKRRVSNLSSLTSCVVDETSMSDHLEHADSVNNNSHGRLLEVFGLAHDNRQPRHAHSKDTHIDHDTILDALGSSKDVFANPGTSSSVENVLLMLQKGLSAPDASAHRDTRTIENEYREKDTDKPQSNMTGVKRRPNRWWSEEEVQVLKAGLFKYGPGAWAKILREHGDVLCNRTQVDLKDKWRNMRRNHDDADVKAILGMSHSMKE